MGDRKLRLACDAVSAQALLPWRLPWRSTSTSCWLCCFDFLVLYKSRPCWMKRSVNCPSMLMWFGHKRCLRRIPLSIAHGDGDVM